jgi:N-acetylneuraminic acid mutarotase
MRSLTPAVLLASFSAIAQTWTQLPDFPAIERDDASAFVIGTDIYVGTGMDAGFQLTSDWYRFNTLTNAWSPVAALPAAGRQYASTFVIDDQGYLFGGTVAGSATNELWRFDPSSGAWGSRASNTDSAFASTAFTLDGTGHVVSGNLASGLPSNFHWVYDPVGDTWTMAMPLPGPPLHRAASFVHDGTAYVCAGSLAPLLAVAESYAYLPMIANWETRAPLPAPRFSADAVGVPDGGVFVCGGTYDPPSVAHNDVWHYIAALDAWEEMPPFPPGGRRGAVIAFVPPNKVYYGTGSDNVVRYKDWWELELAVGMDEAGSSTAFTLFPTIADEVMNIRLPLSTGPADVTITDLAGRAVMSTRIPGGSTSISTAAFRAGLYVATVRSAAATASQRFMVMH